MKTTLPVVALALVLVAVPTLARQTPDKIVAAYESLADVILGVRQAERTFVLSLLDGHHHAAKMLYKKGDWEGAAAEMALFANEGDNAVGGIRKRLVEGGHHHNAAGEQAGIFEQGYVVVTREAKQKMLAAATALRQAADEAARTAAWEDYAVIADELLKGE